MSSRTQSQRNAFTLIELMVALAIASVLTLIALPAAREALRQNTITRSSEIVRQVFLNARAQAIRLNRPFGVVLRRAGETGIRADYAYELGFATSVPEYRGDVAGATADVQRFIPVGGHPQTYRIFVASAVAGRLYRDVQLFNNTAAGITDQERNATTLRDGALITLGDDFGPLRIESSRTITTPYVGVELVARYPWVQHASVVAPSVPLVPPAPATASTPLRFAIQGVPIDSFLPDVQMPKDSIIDLGMSGMGVQGLQFNSLAIGCSASIDGTTPAPTAAPWSTTGFDRVVIMFDGSGRVGEVYYEAWSEAGGTYRVIRHDVTGSIYVAIGRTDGVRLLDEIDQFDTAEANRGALPNYATPETVWLTIRGSSGAVGISPQPPALEPKATYYTTRGLTVPTNSDDCAEYRAQLSILAERVIDGRRLARAGSLLQ